MSEDQTKIVIEYMDSALARIGEIVSPIRDDVTEIKTKVSEIDDIKQEIITMRKALTETNTELRNLDKAVGNLEHKMDRIDTLAIGAYDIARKHEKRIIKLEQKTA